MHCFTFDALRRSVAGRLSQFGVDRKLKVTLILNPMHGLDKPPARQVSESEAGARVAHQRFRGGSGRRRGGEMSHFAARPRIAFTIEVKFQFGQS